MALCRILDRYDPRQGTCCFSCGFSRNCERREAILGSVTHRLSPNGGHLGGINLNVYFDNYKAQRSLQDTLRNYPLTFWVLEQRRCIRDGSHVFGLRREIPW